MRKSVFAVLVVASTATPVFAQDKAPFSGPRIEGKVGYEAADIGNESSDGVSYGAAVGYDFQLGGAVLGIEGEASDSTVDECVAGVVTPGDELCGKLGRDLYVGGRIGTMVGPKTLLYAKAGYTNARVRLDYEDGTAATGADYSLGENFDGVRAGAGAEFALSPHMFLKAEYRYSNYEQGLEKHQGVAGLGFRF